MSNTRTQAGLRTALGRVRGLGSAKSGTGHWWGLRVTSLALVPLTLWFVVSVITHLGADHAAMVAWLSSPVTAGLMVLTIGVTMHHMVNGLQEVIEDYIHTEWTKIATLLAVKFAGYFLAAVSIIAVLKIAFGR
ncbi:MAG TPA: succinate dehydrogenase, hydrophobic membrane anchor protein [Azospirillaceae bacterium]|nr:succinate dehydrogenase, hydrophobic membrane anchor protein [Azospirillaceae bacterium]